MGLEGISYKSAYEFILGLVICGFTVFVIAYYIAKPKGG